MSAQLVTVFGGTGFLGRRVVGHLRDAGFAVRIAARHAPQGGTAPGIAYLRADVSDDASVVAALGGAWAVVNAVSLYVERGPHTFRSVHVAAAERVAEARQAGVERLVHLSGIGADARSPSPYIRSRGEGEAAVRRAFPAATLVRPAAMFGPDDALVRPLSQMLRHMPAFPLFGRGETRLQPVYVEDVAEGIVRILRVPAIAVADDRRGGGPQARPVPGSVQPALAIDLSTEITLSQQPIRRRRATCSATGQRAQRAISNGASPSGFATAQRPISPPPRSPNYSLSPSRSRPLLSRNVVRALLQARQVVARLCRAFPNNCC